MATTVKRATQNTAILSLRTTKPASLNRRMPSQAYRPIAQAALPYVVGLIHSKASAAAASQHRDHHDDSDLASDGERHPLISDDREQDEDSTSPRQDRRAASKSTGKKTTQQQSNLTLEGILLTPGTRTTRWKHVSFGHDAKQGPKATRASSTEWPDGERVGLQQSNCRRRRRRYDADDEEDCSPITGSDAKQGKDGDVVQPPRGKRRKVNTAPKRQARLRTNSPSQQAQQGPKRRQSQRRVSDPQSSGASALGEETPEAAFASFEEWPPEAVLKRVWVEFTCNPCTNHGRHERAAERPRRKSPAGGISLTARTLSSRVASTNEKV
jgi:hypothetical protein